MTVEHPNPAVRISIEFVPERKESKPGEQIGKIENLTWYDKDGTPHAPETLTPEEEAGGLGFRDAQSITLVKVEGSCYILVYINGRWVKVPVSC